MAELGQAHELSPALRWAQSLNTTFVLVKFATRFDSPACLQVSNVIVTITNNTQLLVQGLCQRSDAQTLLYKLDITLAQEVQAFEIDESTMALYEESMKDYEQQKEDHDKKVEIYNEKLKKWKDFKTQVENSLKTFKKQLEEAKRDGKSTSLAESKVDVAQEELDEHKLKKPEKPADAPVAPVRPEASTFEMQSVGRVYLMLVKKRKAKWKALQHADSKKVPNQQLWWEIYEKYEGELKEDGDAASGVKSEKKKGKKSKKRKAAKSKNKEEL